MVAIFKGAITADEVKVRARAFGADLVGIADGRALDANPGGKGRPGDLTAHDGDRVIVLAKHINAGTTRITAWNDRMKYYNDELALTALEETALSLVYWLEDQGYPAIIVPQTQLNPWDYTEDPAEHLDTLISLPHAAVQAGLGTLGLNMQLLTPEYGPRVLLTAVLTSAPVMADAPMADALCLGPSCGRCLRTCPGDVVQHWDRDWSACDRFRSPHGFAALVDHMTAIIRAGDAEKQAEMLRSKESFDLWQSILRGSGVMTGCRRCQDVCPVGEDYERMLRDALDVIPENTPEKEARLAAMVEAERAGKLPPGMADKLHWTGRLKPQ